MAKVSITFHIDDDVSPSSFVSTLLQALNGYDDAVYLLRKTVRMICRAVDPVIDTGEYQISINWCVSDVKEVRPDLSDEQCVDVLDHVKHNHDANIGVSWETLDIVADLLFPEDDEGDDTSAGAGD